MREGQGRRREVVEREGRSVGGGGKKGRVGRGRRRYGRNKRRREAVIGHKEREAGGTRVTLTVLQLIWTCERSREVLSHDQPSATAL